MDSEFSVLLLVLPMIFMDCEVALAIEDGEIVLGDSDFRPLKLSVFMGSPILAAVDDVINDPKRPRSGALLCDLLPTPEIFIPNFFSSSFFIFSFDSSSLKNSTDNILPVSSGNFIPLMPLYAASAASTESYFFFMINII